MKNKSLLETLKKASEKAGSVEVKPRSHRLRQLRDFIEDKGGVIHKKEAEKLGYSLKSLGVNTIIDGKGKLTSDAVESFIKSKPGHEYNYTTGIFGPKHEAYIKNRAESVGVGHLFHPQLHNNKDTKVFQVNLTDKHEEKLKEAGLWDTFNHLRDFSNESGHPVGPRGIGWVRYSEGPDGIFKDESQTDYYQDYEKRMDRQGEQLIEGGVYTRDQANQLRDIVKERFPTDKVRAVNDIIWGGHKPHEILHEAFHQYMRNTGKAHMPIHMWDSDSKSVILGEDPEKPVSANVKETYTYPKKLGFEPGEYGELSSQDNESFSGWDTWKDKIRKSRVDVLKRVTAGFQKPTQNASSKLPSGDRTPSKPDKHIRADSQTEINFELEKGSMRRLAPNPNKDFTDKDVGNADYWQSEEGKEERDKIPPAKGDLRKRILHKLAGKTESRINEKTGEREFLLHRGMSSKEHDLHRENSISNSRLSWSPSKKASLSFAIDATGSDDRAGVIWSHWVPEKAIHNAPEHLQNKDSNIETGRDLYPEESEILVDHSAMDMNDNIHEIKKYKSKLDGSKDMGNEIRSRMYGNTNRRITSGIPTSKMKNKMQKAFEMVGGVEGDYGMHKADDYLKKAYDKRWAHFRKSTQDIIKEKIRTKDRVFVALDGDNIGASVERAAMKDDLQTIIDQSRKISKGAQVIKKWAEDHDGDIYIYGGDDVAFTLPESLVSKLDTLRYKYTKATGFTVTIGVGKSISRAGHAMLYGKLNGKNQVNEWAPEIDRFLKIKSRKLTQEEKMAEHGLLGKSEPFDFASYGDLKKDSDETYSFDYNPALSMIDKEYATKQVNKVAEAFANGKLPERKLPSLIPANGVNKENLNKIYNASQDRNKFADAYQAYGLILSKEGLDDDILEHGVKSLMNNQDFRKNIALSSVIKRREDLKPEILTSIYKNHRSLREEVLKHSNTPNEILYGALKSFDKKEQDIARGKLLHRGEIEGERMSFSVGASKARDLRDKIEESGGALHVSRIKKMGFDPNSDFIKNLKDEKGVVSSGDLQSYIEGAPKHEYSHSTSKWGFDEDLYDAEFSEYDGEFYDPEEVPDPADEQRHSTGASKVFQLNYTPDHVSKLKEAGLWDEFSKTHQKTQGYDHPHNKSHGLGWVRYTEGEDGYHIDEIQTDFGKKDLSKDLPKEKSEKIHEILWGGNHPSQVLHEAFHQNLRDKGEVGKKIHHWQLKPKADLVLGNEEKNPPIHLREGYDKVPKKMGYKPSKYGSIKTQDNPDHTGKDTWETTLKKKDEIEGGLADKKSYNDFNPGALKQGIKVELEHTNKFEIAREIAMDHLTEDPEYYDKLALVEDSKMEKAFFRSGSWYPDHNDKDGMPHPAKRDKIKGTAANGMPIWYNSGDTARSHERGFVGHFKTFLGKNKLSEQGNGLLRQLAEKVYNDPDKHAIASGTTPNAPRGHKELRLRHLGYAFAGADGYDIKENPNGIEVHAPRHSQASGKTGEKTIWHFDGKELKSFHKKPISNNNNGNIRGWRRNEKSDPRSDSRSQLGHGRRNGPSGRVRKSLGDAVTRAFTNRDRLSPISVYRPRAGQSLAKSLQAEPHVASVAVIKGNKILMGQRNDNEKWTTPGGHLDIGEDPKSGALRELKEEAGIDPTALYYLGTEKVKCGDGKERVIHCFCAFGEYSTNSDRDPDQEVDDWEWIDCSDGLPVEVEEELHSPKNVLFKMLGLLEW